jgi:cyclohexadieny/prephenate dehydrogenase
MAEKSLFNQITIIGLGLIGSSLARIIREKGLARRIIGCSTSSETLAKAKELGIIDAGILSAADAVKRSELVILCTPLATYGTLAAQMAAQLKPGCILTDVGSVKHYAIDEITAHLRHGQLFIPAHPIAGSEQSGIEAGHTELFRGKKLIITPATGFHGKAACDKVTALWQACGASVELLKPEKHDSIYASMSHAVQMVAYAYALSLKENGEDAVATAAQQMDAIFRQFTRLSASDPVMWRDIAIANRTPIVKALTRFTSELRTIAALDSDELLKLCTRQAKARKKIRPGEPVEAVKRSYSETNSYFATAVALPVLIACAAMETFIETDFAGSGFYSLTIPLLNLPALTETRLAQHNARISGAVQALVVTLEELTARIEAGDMAALMSSFEASNNVNAAIYSDNA